MTLILPLKVTELQLAEVDTSYQEMYPLHLLDYIGLQSTFLKLCLNYRPVKVPVKRPAFPLNSNKNEFQRAGKK